MPPFERLKFSTKRIEWSPPGLTSSTLTIHVRRYSTLFTHASTLFDDNMAQIFDDNMAKNFDHRQIPHTWTHNFVAFFKFRSIMSSKKSNFGPCYRRNRRILIHVIAMPTISIKFSTLFDVIYPCFDVVWRYLAMLRRCSPIKYRRSCEASV